MATWVWLLLVPLALTACGTAQAARTATPDSASPLPVAAAPAGGVAWAQGKTFAELGWTNAPAELIGLPDGVLVTTRVDQPNVLTALGEPTAAAAVGEFLRVNLPLAGWKITGDAPNALLFSRPGFQGAFTIAPDLWGLTVRVKPA